jgi:hypothetical protein
LRNLGKVGNVGAVGKNRPIFNRIKEQLMPITTYSDIKAEVINNLEYITGSQYPEDLLDELADSAVPIYYSDIISEWTELPSDGRDRWEEFGIYDANEVTITKLMTLDLLMHYRDEFRLAFNEIQKDIEENGNVVDLDVEHAGHYTTFGTYFCDTCNSPYCQKA